MEDLGNRRGGSGFVEEVFVDMYDMWVSGERF